MNRAPLIPHRLYLILCTALFFFLSAMIVSAQTPQYTPLVGLPGLSGTETKSLAEYFNQLYLLTIVVGCFIAVLKITMAGVKWALSDVVTDKSSAREDIKGALLGLAILLVPFVVLNTINPNLTNLNILRNAGSVRPTTPSQVSSGVPGAPQTQGVDPATQKADSIKQACIDQNKKATGYTYTYDEATKTCKSTPTNVEKVTYQRSELTNEINAEWKQKCGAKLQVDANPDGSRTYYCRP